MPEPLDAATVECPECGRRLCEECVVTGRCLGCIPDDEIDETLAEAGVR